MEIIDLKQREDFLQQYINLRNSYSELLLTKPVSISETREWMRKDDVEIRGIVKEHTLCGVVVLYLDKGGEVSFFVKEKGRGIGSELLKIIEQVAREKELGSICAYVLKENTIAKRVFEKNGYLKGKIVEKNYKGVFKQGTEYKKFIT